MKNLLWIPKSKTDDRQTYVEQYINHANARFSLQLTGARDLYAWTVAQPLDFWESFLDFSEIRIDKQGPVLKNPAAMPGAQWFPHCTLNVAENLLRTCRDNPDKIALIFYSEKQIRRDLTGARLYAQTERLWQHLQNSGLNAGDRVAAITPNCPEAIAGMLATSALGAIWSSCSPDFGVQGILDRFSQIEPAVLIAADGYFYKGRWIDIRPKLQEISAALPSVQEIVLFSIRNAAADPVSFPATDWADIQARKPARSISFTPLPFNHPLYILFSSGTTGKPKCIVHGAGGTLLEHAKELLLHTDIRPTDTFFYATTCGWMMWNWLISGLYTGATLVLYDGFPLLNDGTVLFELAEETGITVFGTSAGYLSAVENSGLRPSDRFDLSRIRTILSTGSVLTPEQFDYVYDAISDSALLASVSGGTDIVGCFALGCPILPVMRGELQTRSFGCAVDVFDAAGNSVRDTKGELVCTAPFPSMPVRFWNDPDGSRYRSAYFERFPGVWHHGDFVTLTSEGGLIFYGRSDAVLNPGGVRIGTAEIYRQLSAFPAIANAVVVGRLTGADERIALFVTSQQADLCSAEFVQALKAYIKENASPRHVPYYVLQVPDIPVTRSGKISEIAVRKRIHGEPVDNTEALANPDSLQYFHPDMFS